MKPPMRLLLLALPIFWLGLGILTGPDPALAASDKSVQKIAAVVNDGVVSEYDLEQRLSLAISTMGVPDTPRTRQQLRRRVLDSLIDELLQVQEAKEKEVQLEEDEIESTIESLSRQNDLSLKEFSDMLMESGITLQTLAGQVAADLMWRKLIRGSFLPRVSDEEVDRIIAQRKASKGKPEYQLSEIVITVEKPEERPEALREANRLLEQMRKGANFGVVARQFSDGSTSA
ncbi:MAG: SurA N-terminal domain-containing protein, partial [Rhodospirillales bacterium]|nr:SurA N-terminal domain-containing protein [Rhodospirillales bacterium]